MDTLAKLCSGLTNDEGTTLQLMQNLNRQNTVHSLRTHGDNRANTYTRIYISNIAKAPSGFPQQWLSLYAFFATLHLVAAASGPHLI